MEPKVKRQKGTEVRHSRRPPPSAPPATTPATAPYLVPRRDQHRRVGVVGQETAGDLEANAFVSARHSHDGLPGRGGHGTDCNGRGRTGATAAAATQHGMGTSGGAGGGVGPSTRPAGGGRPSVMPKGAGVGLCASGVPPLRSGPRTPTCREVIMVGRVQRRGRRHCASFVCPRTGPWR